MSSCKFCNQPITWVTTSAKDRIPLDTKPCLMWSETRPGMWQQTFCYTSHLVTCPKRPSYDNRRNPD